MKIKVIAFAAIFGFISIKTEAQQKAMYSQYMFNNLAINPAYAAVHEAFVINSIYRQQWVGFKGAPNTQTISLHTQIKSSNTFVGAVLIRDQIAEVIKENGGYLSLTQRIEIGDDIFLAAGLNGGLSSAQANYSQANSIDDFGNSPNSGTDPAFKDVKKIRSILGLGLMLFSDKYYFGLSSPEFYSRDYYRDLSARPTTLTAYRPEYMFQGGYIFDPGGQFKIKPNFLITYTNGSPINFDLNTNVLIKETFWVGASYRHKNSVTALLSLNITPDIQFGYSYDFVTTELAKAQNGSHELMLKFRFPSPGSDFRTLYF